MPCGLSVGLRPFTCMIARPKTARDVVVQKSISSEPTSSNCDLVCSGYYWCTETLTVVRCTVLIPRDQRSLGCWKMVQSMTFSLSLLISCNNIWLCPLYHADETVGGFRCLLLCVILTYVSIFLTVTNFWRQFVNVPDFSIDF